MTSDDWEPRWRSRPWGNGTLSRCRRHITHPNPAPSLPASVGGGAGRFALTSSMHPEKTSATSEWPDPHDRIVSVRWRPNLSSIRVTYDVEREAFLRDNRRHNADHNGMGQRAPDINSEAST